MIGAGTVINPIIKIVTTVVILGAVYLFFVKPALDTTEDITDRAFDGIPSAEEIFENVPNSSQIQSDIQDSLNQANLQGVDTDKLVNCIQNAGQNVNRIERCTKRFGAN